ncbi:unnamed protein product [Anisakis simplex]|uniref:Uncharacterized protein n=1 Tax=Anisakis simplex TaxID=6269 RepID=A0A0M3KIQ1_ANISI|nr:unnamed protein product [Anisakis simplex]
MKTSLASLCGIIDCLKNDPNLEFSFDEKALDEEVKEFGTPLDKSTNHRLRELTTSDLQIQFHNNHRMAHPSSQKARSADLFKTSKALQRKPALKISLSGNDNARIVENYKQVEQEEYDKFISSLQNQLSVENPETTSATQLIVSDQEATPTITTVASSELPTVPVSPIIPALRMLPSVELINFFLSLWRKISLRIYDCIKQSIALRMIQTYNFLSTTK